MIRARALFLPLLMTVLFVGAGCAMDGSRRHDERSSMAPPSVPQDPPAPAQGHEHGHDDTEQDKKGGKPAARKKITTDVGDEPYGASAITLAGPLTVRAALGHSIYSKTTPRRLVLKVDLSAASTEPIKRKPLNLALVFDRSGSMADQQKFEFAMKAARTVIENLSDRDVISLIVFGDDAVVLSPAGYAVNKEYLYHRLTEFEPDGNTNMSAGMLEAFAQIDSKSVEGQHKQVIVLTDGLANRGVTNSKKLSRMVTKARSRGIHLSAIGCGTEFDEKLMVSVATAGGGRYAYVKNAEQIPAAVSAELNGLLDVVAQNVKLEIRPSSGSTITRLFGRLLDASIPVHAMDVGDMRDVESGVSLIEIDPGVRKAGATVDVAITLTFDDPETGVRVKRVTRVRARFLNQTTRARASENRGVMLYAGVLEAMEKAEEAIQGLDTDRFKSLRASFDRVYEETRRHAMTSRDQLLLNHAFLLKHYMGELWEASENALLHGHSEARKDLKKDIEYRRYLLGHHRGVPKRGAPKRGAHREHEER